MAEQKEMSRGEWLAGAVLCLGWAALEYYSGFVAHEHIATFGGSQRNAHIGMTGLPLMIAVMGIHEAFWPSEKPVEKHATTFHVVFGISFMGLIVLSLL